MFFSEEKNQKTFNSGVFPAFGTWPAGRENGAALVVALWAVMAMALLVAGVRILGARAAMLAEARLEQVQLAAAADGMINLTLLRLMDLGAGGHPPVDGRPVRLLFAGLAGEVRVQDEAGKIDLNQAPKPLLMRLLLSQHADFDTAQGLSDAILDWREPGAGRRLNGAKAEDYRRAGIAYGPRGGKMETVDELRLVMGMTESLYLALAPCLTVASQNAWPDQAVAPDSVLRALDGMDDARIAAIEASRAARLVTQPDGSLADTSPPPSVGRAFSISVQVEGRTTGVQRRAVVRLTGIPKAPYVVYQWN